MKTTVEFLDGKVEILLAQAPVIDLVERKMYGVDDEGDASTEEVPLRTVRRIIFEPHDN